MLAHNTNTNNYNYQNQLKKNRKLVIKAIQLGVELMRKQNDLTNEFLFEWVNYTEEVLKVCVGNSQSNIYIHFLELKIELELLNVEPVVKISNYIEYLFNVVNAYDEL